MMYRKAAYNILPETEEILKTVGEQIKLARLRRDLPAELVAERAGISRASLWKIESGNPAVVIGIYAAALHALGGMDKDMLFVAKDDELGRQFPQGKEIFGMFADTSPDRWGRVLMNKRERLQAEREGRKPRKLYDSDYLLGVYDEARIGGIRLKLDIIYTHEMEKSDMWSAYLIETTKKKN